MNSSKTCFALVIGNRGFFPSSLLIEARNEMKEVLESLGHQVIMPDEKATAHGAVETPREGRIYAEFLQKHRGEYGGVILSLPNFGDETGAVEALRDCGVPIFIQAYPDELDKMAPELRRDAFCGKFSVMDVFTQYGLPFTSLTPHTVSPRSDAFVRNIEYFDRVCMVYNALKHSVIGAVGARTTAFKTVRIDELALQRNGITMETLDLSEIIARTGDMQNSSAVEQKAEVLRSLTNWDQVPQQAFDTLAKLGVVIDEVIEEYRMDALALRCWVEMQKQLNVSPCILLSELNQRGIPAACEVDVGNAVTMLALKAASGSPAACLDWNNNYGDDEDACILFHCGPVPSSLMTSKGQISDHLILANSVGEGCGYGCNTGRIAPVPFSFGSMLTEEGKLKFYLGEGEFTNDPIPQEFFGCAGVARIENLQEKLQTIGYLGHRHHTSITPGHLVKPVQEAMVKYLGYEVTLL